MNTPSSETISDASLRLYFSAWRATAEIVIDFQRAYEDEHFPGEKQNQWVDEWNDYQAFFQSDLQDAFLLFQQSNELALKARICEVSPYLLLLDGGMKFRFDPQEVDFGDLRTIDAVDLPKAVNTLTSNSVSQRLLELYDKFRSDRNRIVHLGISSNQYLPFSLLERMLETYSELWPDRNWLADRVEFGSKRAIGYFDDGDHYTVRGEALLELKITRRVASKSIFQKLFRTAKSKRRYLCPECIDRSITDWMDVDADEMGTATLLSETQLQCIMCQTVFEIVRDKCDHCVGNVIFAEETEYAAMCATCREYTG